MRRLFLLTYVVLSGCAAPVEPTYRAPQPLSAQALVGGWVHQGDACESDTGVTYSADGTFGSYDVFGTWALTGNRLTTVTTERGEPDEPVRPVKPPEHHTSVVAHLSTDTLVEQWSDGTVHRYRRCP